MPMWTFEPGHTAAAFRARHMTRKRFSTTADRIALEHPTDTDREAALASFGRLRPLEPDWADEGPNP